MTGQRTSAFARVVLVGFALACLGVLALAAVRRSASIIYWVGPMAGLAFAWFTLRRSDEAKVNAALTLVAVGAALYAAEAALFAGGLGHYETRFDWEKRRIAAARAQGIDYDLRSQLEVVTDLNEQGVDAVARVHPSTFLASNGIGADDERVFPLAGISGRVTVTCNELGEWILVEADEHGFRNPPGLHDGRDIDVVLIGDSYAFSSCVPQGTGLAASLRAGGRTVLNLAYGGNGPLTALAALTEYGVAHVPAAVVWMWYEGNDFLDLAAEARAPLLLRYLDPGFGQGLSSRQPLLDSLLLAYHERRRAEASSSAGTRWRCVVILCGVRNLTAREGADRPDPDTDEPTAPEPPPGRSHPVELFAQVLETARDRVREWGGELYFVYVPAWIRYADPMDRDGLNGRPLVLGEVTEAGVPLIDFVEILDRHPDPLALFPYRERGHFNREGYAFLAEHIARRLDPLDGGASP